MPESRFHLDQDQRASLRACLKEESLPLLEPSDRFFERIEASINHYLRSKPEETFRDAHDALRAVWKRCQIDPPPVKVLEVTKLPNAALQSMGRRARKVIPTLFPGESIQDSVSDSPERLATGLLAWIEAAEDRKFVEALRVLSADGALLVPGRSRGSGKRSRAQPEPVILGEARGAGSRSHRGGHPKDEGARKLVMYLAGDWFRATGELRGSGRSDRSGFGKLVHLVFGWIFVPMEASQEAIDAAITRTTEVAGYRLRQFWKEVEGGRALPRLHDFLARHGEE